MERKWISNGDWFDFGTEAVFLGYMAIDDEKNDPINTGKLNMDSCAIFKGIKNGKDDEEGCSFREFTQLIDGKVFLYECGYCKEDFTIPFDYCPRCGKRREI